MKIGQIVYYLDSDKVLHADRIEDIQDNLVCLRERGWTQGSNVSETPEGVVDIVRNELTSEQTVLRLRIRSLHQRLKTVNDALLEPPTAISAEMIEAAHSRLADAELIERPNYLDQEQ